MQIGSRLEVLEAGMQELADSNQPTDWGMGMKSPSMACGGIGGDKRRHAQCVEHTINGTLNVCACRPEVEYGGTGGGLLNARGGTPGGTGGGPGMSGGPGEGHWVTQEFAGVKDRLDGIERRAEASSLAHPAMQCIEHLIGQEVLSEALSAISSDFRQALGRLLSKCVLALWHEKEGSEELRVLVHRLKNDLDNTTSMAQDTQQDNTKSKAQDMQEHITGHVSEHEHGT
eukprot:scaffold10941_cov21-Tisochrysis_lutea.AAC.3